jgi:RodZ C-terminal domain
VKVVSGAIVTVMPETRLERAVFALGLLAMAVLAVVIARSWPHTAAANTTTNAPAATAESTTKASPHTVVLALTAIRATWIEVRAASSNGALLSTGTLPAGTTKTFRSATIWVRFGAASNIDAKLNGRPLPLPSGTYDAVFGTAGFAKTRG